MNINVDSWHYAWYRWTYTCWKKQPPQRTNLCQYVQRIFWTTLLHIPMGIVAALLLLLYYVVLTPFALIIGYRPYWFLSPKFDPNWGVFESYQGLRIPKTDFRILPWQPILLGIIVLSERALWHYHFTGALIGHSIVLSLIVLVVGLIWSVESDNEAAKLLREYVSAKKNRFCPTVEFSKNATSSSEE
jgi:hypothetical protein